MKQYPLGAELKKKALAFKDQILYEHHADIEISGSENEGDAIYIIRTDFHYRLQTIRDEFFEGDGLIVKFDEENDLRPLYIMISHKTLIKKHHEDEE